LRVTVSNYLKTCLIVRFDTRGANSSRPAP
jgi:hypothetical protein